MARRKILAYHPLLNYTVRTEETEGNKRKYAPLTYDIHSKKG